MFHGHADVVKHVKHFHPEWNIEFKCGQCGYKGTGKYLLKSIKVHQVKEHFGEEEAEPLQLTYIKDGEEPDSDPPARGER